MQCWLPQQCDTASVILWPRPLHDCNPHAQQCAKVKSSTGQIAPRLLRRELRFASTGRESKNGSKQLAKHSTANARRAKGWSRRQAERRLSFSEVSVQLRERADALASSTKNILPGLKDSLVRFRPPETGRGAALQGQFFGNLRLLLKGRVTRESTPRS